MPGTDRLLATAEAGAMSAGLPRDTADWSMMEISTRNQLPGKIVSTKLGTIMAEVVVEVDPATIVAAITRSSVEHLDLQPGDFVRVIIKSTEVMIAK